MAFIILMLILAILYQRYIIKEIQQSIDKNEEELEKVTDIIRWKILVEEKVVKLAYKYNANIELISKLYETNGELIVSKKLMIGGEEKAVLTHYSYRYIYTVISDIVQEILEG